MTAELVTNFEWVNQLIANNPHLAAMAHTVSQHDGMVSVEVAGAHWEAREWRAAIQGRILPSHIDGHGVRRQVVIGSRVQVCVVEHPQKRGV